MNFKNIVFDLGNVIVDLDIPLAQQKFETLLGYSFMNAEGDDLETFLSFETGKISEAIFLNFFIKKAGGNTQARDVLDAWNSMLVGIPAERLEMLLQLRKQYRTFFLSNTNPSHLRWVSNYLRNHHASAQLEDFVEKAYYSNELGLRKPDLGIFQTLLEQEQLIPNETLFFDDMLENIEAAKSLNIQAVHVLPTDEIIEVTRQYLG